MGFNLEMQEVNRKTQLPLKEESVGTQRAVSVTPNRNIPLKTHHCPDGES
jgi:hypothetical protein